MKREILRGLPVVVCLLLAPLRAARATERRFSFTYETGVLQPGQAEIEPWTTFRVGREHFYARIDQRLEFEIGLVKNLQTALYWNFSRVTEAVRDPTTGGLVRNSSFTMDSVSSEWKYKLADPLADAIGFAVYLEGTYGPDEQEIEAKLLFDKQWDGFLAAANLVGEQEWEHAGGTTESEQGFELDLGFGYFVAPSFVLGVEAVSASLVEEGRVESSAVYAGPAISHASGRYWLSFSLLPQVFAPKSGGGGALDLAHGENLRARLLLGFHL